MQFMRTFSTKDVHPYDEVTWEQRDVVQENRVTGEVIFEQRGVEFPDFWSMNAVTIATTKYFRGALGTDEREYSLRQLIDRVVKTYRKAGEDGGYFSAKDGQVFEEELTWLLLHQYFSFNSPVWFNVGTDAPQQVSACQPYDALVTTEHGLRRIGDLHRESASGTMVATANGDALILATKHNGRKEVLRITTASGHEVDVTADHLVWTRGKGFIPAGDIQIGDQVTWHRQQAHVPALVGARGLSSHQAEAALAGWLATDGFVGQYDHGTSRSLIVEPHTINDDEYAWVTQGLDLVFPDAHFHERLSDTIDPKVDFRRRRAYGEQFRSYVERWGLLSRGVSATVPEQLLTADLDVVAAWLKSVFQADGYVSHRDKTAQIGIATEAEHFIKGIQTLLSRFGIFSRVSSQEDYRTNRHTRWVLSIMNHGDRELFAQHIGFISDDKQTKLLESLGISGRSANDTKTLQVKSIVSRGVMDVYDIQTTEGEYLTSGGIRVHNCFILSVDDTMESILDWYKEEGVIFKGGSGAGVNLSKIRSSQELLSSGGTASGPVSFMRGADASAGTIKSGGATRRAAKLVALDVDHPDIEEFIETKAREEDKIRVLRDAGYDMELGGKDSISVQYQNANNSVRVSDEFMRAVENKEPFDLTARTDGHVVATVDAHELFGKMAKAAWECADPGIQYDDTINAWHTIPEAGRITASNPCSEYMSIDNSSCNLASLNLMKFNHPDATFDTDRFVAAVRLIIIAMDISIEFGHFPTPEITENTKKYRQLGIGYANLGALLMSWGLPYDSDEGRAVAASITSLMSAAAYEQSTVIAQHLSPYHEYDNHVDAHVAVLEDHLTYSVRAQKEAPWRTKKAHSIFDTARDLWRSAVVRADSHGLRNSQISLLAPTGTIGFLMDVDTTGVEPDFSLVKFKKLVGGGSMQIVNQIVPLALASLGYSQNAADEIIEFISEHGHVVGAPDLLEEDYPVFDCAVGKRPIDPMGHVRMMAAVQPFLSGAISKTVNVPESATVEDIEHIYMQGWKLGLKALAVYRDNCKVGQPLSSAKTEKAIEPAVHTVNKDASVGPQRNRLPRTRQSRTTSFSVGGADGYITSGEYDTGELGELFLKLGKQGSTLAGVMDAFSIAISIGLQYGVPLESFVRKFTNMKFEPAGITNDPDLRMAQSIIDYVFQRLALDYMSYEERSELGVYTAAERARQVETGSYTEESPKQPIASAKIVISPDVVATHDAPLCMTCGTKMRPSGSCHVCEGCGSTSGCS